MALLYIIAFVSGVAWKVYDDVVDNNIYIESSLELEFIKVFMVCTGTLYLYLDIFLSVLFIALIIPINIYIKGIDNNVWKAMCILPFITLACGYDRIGTLAVHSIQRVIVIVLYGILMLIDDKFFPEETSTKKTISRSFATILLVVTLYYIHELNMISFMEIRPFIVWGLGYLVSNIVFHTLFFKTQLTTISV